MDLPLMRHGSVTQKAQLCLELCEQGEHRDLVLLSWRSTSPKHRGRGYRARPGSQKQGL